MFGNTSKTSKQNICHFESEAIERIILMQLKLSSSTIANKTVETATIEEKSHTEKMQQKAVMIQTSNPHPSTCTGGIIKRLHSFIFTTRDFLHH